MAKVRGRGAVSRFLNQLPEEIAAKLLVGGARKGATVIADEAKATTKSKEIAGAIKVAVKREEGRIVARVQVKGAGAYLAPWEEYGTDPHFIAVDDSQRAGTTVARINRLDRAARKEGRIGPGQSLVINGEFVGDTVHHPGARAHPFLRPALDRKEGEAIAAVRDYIAARITPAGITGTAEKEDA